MAYLFDVHLHPPRVRSIGWQDRCDQLDSSLGMCSVSANISSISMDPQRLDHIIEVIYIYIFDIYIYYIYYIYICYTCLCIHISIYMSMYIYNYIYIYICGLHYIYRSMDHMWSMQQDDLLQLQHGAALRYIYPSHFEGPSRSATDVPRSHLGREILMVCM